MERPELEYVGFWRRVVATLIDTVLLLAITWPLLYAIYGEQYFGSEKWIEGPADFILTWLVPAIATMCFWVARGQTPGKMAVGAVIVDAETGEAISFSKAFLRYIGYYVSAIALCVGYIWVAIDPQKRGWHDHMAGTVVVRKRSVVVFEKA